MLATLRKTCSRRWAAEGMTGANHYDFGFRLVGDELVMMADEWGFRDNLTEILGQITQRYAYHVCREQAEAQGFQVIGTETQADGSIRLVVQRYT